MKFKLLLLVFLTVMSCKQDTKEVATAGENDDLKVYDYEGLAPLLHQNDDKTYVINFWATWCKPCIKELPYFEKLNENYSGKNVEVILVSLDFPQHFDTKLKTYIKENNLKSKVVALDDPDMNSWIPKINEKWTGAIPATIIYNKNGRKFYEQSFEYDELVLELRQFIEQ